jgi:hypothetical protein
MDPALDPWSQTMGALAEPVRANPWLLLLAGGIMAATLWVSKKARGVTATSLNLGRQSEGTERFQSIAPARSIVRIVLAVFRFFSFITPEPLKRRVESRFDNSYWKPVPDENGEEPSFDTLRAAVNLLVSAMLITIGTTLKLPLSTTYVTFMVAMATALPDRAWGRDSAVYRVSGVLTVIGGWFFTAFMAASVAAIIATIIFYGELVGLVLLTSLAAFILIRTTYVHRKREKEYEEEVKAMRFDEGDFDESIANLILNLGSMIERVSGIVQSTYDGLMKENRSQLKDMRNQTKQLNKQHKILSSHILRTSRLEELEEAVEEKTYGEALSSLHLLMRSLRHLTSQCYVHIDNNHSGFTEEQVNDIEPVLTILLRQLTEIAAYLKEKDFSAMAEINEETEETIRLIRKANKAQLKRSKKEKYTTRTSLLFLELLTECEEILFHARMLLFLCNECHGGEPFILPMKEEVEEEIEESDDRP